MGNARVRLNHAGISAVLHSPGVTADLQRRMGPVLARARAAAPVESGAYRDSLHIVTVQHPSRVAVQVVADVPYAMSVEAATGNLARALDAAGGV